MTRPAPAPPAYCRLTVLAPCTSVDVALPADVPVADLVPMVLELVGEPAPGSPPRPWRLSGAAGGALPVGATLAQLGVLDGELLRIAPVGAAPAPPVFDDPVDALADTANPVGSIRRRTVGTLVVGLAVAASALLSGGGTVAAVVAAIAAGAAVTVVARSTGDRSVALITALAAVPLAAVAGWALLPGAGGAVRLLLAALLAGIVAGAGQVALRVVAPALVGVAMAAVPVVLGCVAVSVFGTPPTATIVAVGALTVVAGPVLPRAALRLSGLPRPVVPADSGELAGADRAADVLPPDELAERADLARGYLAGLVGGAAVVAAVGTVIAATTGWPGVALAAVTAATLGLRSRGFADPGPVCALLTGAAVTAVGLAGVVSLFQGGMWGAVAAGILLVVVGSSLAALHRGQPMASPVARRTVDFTEAGLTIAAVPLAFWAMDLFALAQTF
jgi:type VII secretion integral membrane protein EccD